jgi:hypothetical protein
MGYSLKMPKDWAEEGRSTNSIVDTVDDKYDTFNSRKNLLPTKDHSKYKQIPGAAVDSHYKPFDVKVGPWYKADGKVIKKALKKAKSANAIRELSGDEE